MRTGDPSTNNEAELEQDDASLSGDDEVRHSYSNLQIVTAVSLCHAVRKFSHYEYTQLYIAGSSLNLSVATILNLGHPYIRSIMKYIPPWRHTRR